MAQVKRAVPLLEDVHQGQFVEMSRLGGTWAPLVDI